MAWRKATIRDLTAKLNQKELAAFKQNPDYDSAADPAADLLEQTVEFVRGFCRRNKQLRMSPEVGTIPEGLMSPAMDVAAFDLLKRINVNVNDARKAAWEKALELFEKVASGAFTPESYNEDPTEGDSESNLALPAFSKKTNRRKLLNEYPMI